MTQPAELPIVGRMKMTTTRKEELLEFWRDIERRVDLGIHYQERVDLIDRLPEGFVVRTPKGEYRAISVLLAIGRRGTPRKLGVPGEELPKVVYRLIEPEQYAGQRVLVVGGGDSALEAAASIVETGEGRVTLSYRGDAFQRAKPKNRDRVIAAQRSGMLQVLLKSNVERIDEGFVAIEHKGRHMEIENQAVIINAGGVLPTDFLRRVGIDVETKYGTA
jgi:thioredoxin reductase